MCSQLLFKSGHKKLKSTYIKIEKCLRKIKECSQKIEKCLQNIEKGLQKIEKCLQKPYFLPKCGIETIPRSFSKKSKLTIYLELLSKVLYSLFLVVCQCEASRSILKLSYRTLATELVQLLCATALQYKYQ